jgi:hypothetical protein
MTPPDADEAVARTRAWIERAVIGLNLCPFAKAVYVKERIRYVVSTAETPEALLADLERELAHLAATPAEQTDTTLLIHPRVLADFLDFNDFLDVAEEAVERLGLAGVLQVASFHPRYQFADTKPDDITNFTNRSPWPTLHLLREASVDEAVAAFPEADEIYLRNMQTLRGLGRKGWAELGVGPGGGEDDER